ncbi:MAG: hypothetical protein V1655_00010 [bacterium]
MSKFIKGDKKIVKSKNKFSFLRAMSLNFICLLVLAIVFFLYLGQINSSASRVYEIQDLEKEKASMQEKSDNLKLEIAELKSMSNIEARMGKLSLVDSKDVEYLEKKDVVAVVSR